MGLNVNFLSLLKWKIWFFLADVKIKGKYYILWKRSNCYIDQNLLRYYSSKANIVK